ncbi:MAG: hypothetical protein HY235_14410 [Acidobacteria bacterium]|nr:hypothetical protein [Acidobacteriota bacterium]
MLWLAMCLAALAEQPRIEKIEWPVSKVLEPGWAGWAVGRDCIDRFFAQRIL